mgnify:CR=1 FL=1
MKLGFEWIVKSNILTDRALRYFVLSRDVCWVCVQIGVVSLVEVFWELLVVHVCFFGFLFFLDGQVRLIDNIGYLELYGYEFIFIQKEW